MRRLARPALKLTISLVLVGILARRYGGDAEFRATLARLDIASFLVAEAVLAVGLVLSALRWKILLRAAGVSLGLGGAARLYFAAFFFNFFLPTAVGGDVMRAVSVGRGAPVPVVAGSILVERFLGFGCLLVIGITASFLVSSLEVARGVLLVAAGAFVIGLLLLIVIPLPTTDRGGWLGRILRGLRATAMEVRAYGFHGSALAIGLVLSFVWQGGLVLANWILSEGLGSVATPGSLAALVPTVQAITMIPVSFGGLGLREMGYEFFFAESGFDPAGAVALGACFLGVTVALAVKGGLLYLFWPARDKTPRPAN